MFSGNLRLVPVVFCQIIVHCTLVVVIIYSWSGGVQFELSYILVRAGIGIWIILWSHFTANRSEIICEMQAKAHGEEEVEVKHGVQPSRYEGQNWSHSPSTDDKGSAGGWETHYSDSLSSRSCWEESRKRISSHPGLISLLAQVSPRKSLSTSRRAASKEKANTWDCQAELKSLEWNKLCCIS